MVAYLAAGFEQRGGEAEVLLGQGSQCAAYGVAAGGEGGWLALIGGAAGTLVGLCVRYRTRGGEARDIGGAGTLGASGGD